MYQHVNLPWFGQSQHPSNTPWVSQLGPGGQVLYHYPSGPMGCWIACIRMVLAYFGNLQPRIDPDIASADGSLMLPGYRGGFNCNPNSLDFKLGRLLNSNGLVPVPYPFTGDPMTYSTGSLEQLVFALDTLVKTFKAVIVQIKVAANQTHSVVVTDVSISSDSLYPSLITYSDPAQVRSPIMIAEEFARKIWPSEYAFIVRSNRLLPSYQNLFSLSNSLNNL